MAENRERNRIVRVALIALLAPIIIPLAILAIVFRLLYGASLTAIVWLAWCGRGVDTLVVYSDSPNWHDYMVHAVLPRLDGRSVVLNWSERRHWQWYRLSVAVFRHFGGSREYNPIVIAIRPFRFPRTFRFWQAFRDLKHGNERTLLDVEDQLYAYFELDASGSIV